MKREEVESSNIRSIGYDPASQVLEVEFNYGHLVYQYKGVPAEIYEQLMAAESKGKFLNSAIKSVYDYETVDNES